jgi:hypothetical protein
MANHTHAWWYNMSPLKTTMAMSSGAKGGEAGRKHVGDGDEDG